MQIRAFSGDLSTLDQISKRTVHVDHAELKARLDDHRYFVCTTLSNKVCDRIVVDEQLIGRNEAS